MRFWLRNAVVLALAGLFFFVNAAKADSIQLTYTGTGISGILNLTTNSLGGGVFQVTSITGSQNGQSILAMVPTVPWDAYYMPDGSFYAYDNLIYPTSSPLLDSLGLLFNIQGSSTNPANIYWNGTSYMESTYLGGGNFPNDYTWTPLRLSISSVPEPSTLALFGVGMIALGSIIRRTTKKSAASH